MARKTDLDVFIEQVAVVGRIAFDAETGTRQAYEIGVNAVPKNYLAKIYEVIEAKPQLALLGKAFADQLASQLGLLPGEVGVVMLHAITSGLANLALDTREKRLDPASVTRVASQLIAFAIAVSHAAEVLLMTVSHEQIGEG